MQIYREVLLQKYWSGCIVPIFFFPKLVWYIHNLNHLLPSDILANMQCSTEIAEAAAIWFWSLGQRYFQKFWRPSLDNVSFPPIEQPSDEAVLTRARAEKIAQYESDLKNRKFWRIILPFQRLVEEENQWLIERLPPEYVQNRHNLMEFESEHA